MPKAAATPMAGAPSHLHSVNGGSRIHGTGTTYFPGNMGQYGLVQKIQSTGFPADWLHTSLLRNGRSAKHLHRHNLRFSETSMRAMIIISKARMFSTF
jgi:hypothetical protein